MRLTNYSPNQYYFRRIVMIFVLMFAVLAFGGLSLLWMRNRITECAASIQACERQMAAVSRRAQDMDSRIASLHQPETLKCLAGYYQLKLKEPVREQLVVIHDNNYIRPRFLESEKNMVASKEQPRSLALEFALLNLPKINRN